MAALLGLESLLKYPPEQFSTSPQISKVLILEDQRAELMLLKAECLLHRDFTSFQSSSYSHWFAECNPHLVNTTCIVTSVMPDF